MLNKILTICPTYNRLDLCKQMIQSWHDTIKGDNTLVLGLDISDPYINMYPKNVNKSICKKGSTVTEVINSIWNEQKYKYDYFHITNDDVLYRTKGWDINMVNMLIEKGPGLVYGNDLFQSENLSTFPFISAKIVNALGWLQYPTLNRYCGDSIWNILTINANCHYYLGEVVIEHLHKLAGKGNDDVDMDIYREDMKAYVRWAMTEKNNDIRKVKEVLNGISRN